jgi:hypothetical protein
MLDGEMMLWWLSGGADAQDTHTPFGFFWVRSSTRACGGGLICFYFIFSVSHLLNHVDMWDLFLVPHWLKKKYVVIHPNPN